MTPVAWKLLGRYLKHRNRRAALLALSAAVAGVLEAVVLVLTVQAAVAISEGASQVALAVPFIDELNIRITTMLWAAVVAVVASTGAGLLVARLTAQMSADALASTRAAALRAFSRATWHRQVSHQEGALHETISNQAMQASMLVVVGLKGLIAVISLAALVGAALLVDVTVTLAVVALGSVVFLLLRPITKLTRRRATRFVSTNTYFAQRVAEASALTLEMRAFGVQDDQAEQLVEESERTAREARLTQFSSQSGATLYRNAAILFLVAAVGGLHAVGEVDLSAVGAVVILMVRALSYAQQTQSAIQRANELSPNLVLIDESIRQLQAAQEEFGDERPRRAGVVSLRQVSYRYGDEHEPSLRNVDIDLLPGEVLGVIGPSGAGKSTLVQILLRLRLPTSGSVTIDGRPHVSIAPDVWSELVSLVPQEPRLFEGTVLDNIRFHRSGITRAEIVEAAIKANISEEIERLPAGFDTMLGPRGSGLSGGQRQRLAIARALVGKPQVLVLDEPTSALDGHSEQLLQGTIQYLKGAVTMVIVAHRMNTIAVADRLMILENGEVVALGAPAEVSDHPFLERTQA